MNMNFFQNKNKNQCIYKSDMGEYEVKSQSSISGKNRGDVVLLRFMLLIDYISFLEYLKIQFNTNTEMFLFLISKYMNKFQKLSEKKESSIKIYQEVCNQYQHKTLRINKMIHQILKDISDMTGYSISYIIRLIIEWELEELQIEREMDKDITENFEMKTILTSIISKLVIYHSLDIELEEVKEIIRVGYG